MYDKHIHYTEIKRTCIIHVFHAVGFVCVWAALHRCAPLSCALASVRGHLTAE